VVKKYILGRLVGSKEGALCFLISGRGPRRHSIRGNCDRHLKRRSQITGGSGDVQVLVMPLHASNFLITRAKSRRAYSI